MLAPLPLPFQAIYRKRKVLLKVVTLQFLERGKTASALQGKGDVGGRAGIYNKIIPWSVVSAPRWWGLIRAGSSHLQTYRWTPRTLEVRALFSGSTNDDRTLSTPVFFAAAAERS